MVKLLWLKNISDLIIINIEFYKNSIAIYIFLFNSKKMEYLGTSISL